MQLNHSKPHRFADKHAALQINCHIIMMTPVLYSFRRCPYAIRARLAIAASQLQVELREIILKRKPQAMLAASGKGTVPVLVIDNGQRVIDESWDIMNWALEINDPLALLPDFRQLQNIYLELIRKNDFEFKPWLDRYKYHDRHPEYDKGYYRDHACEFVSELEALLDQQQQLCPTGVNQPGLVDLAILPFIRQFAFCDSDWWQQSEYPNCQDWLNRFLQSDLFSTVMKKYPQWLDEPGPIYFPEAGV